MTIEAILFDFDGVLIDTPHLHHSALNIALRAHGFAAIPEGLSGDTSKDKLKKYFPCYEDSYHSILLQKEYEYDRLFTSAVRYGLKKVLHEFDDYKIGIVTNARNKYVHEYLLHCDIKHDKLAVIITREIVSDRKPSPKCYEKALEILRLKGSNVLAIEDSKEGIEAAHKAGCHIFETDYKRLDVAEIKAFAEAL